jgi:hypothetical protein
MCQMEKLRFQWSTRRQRQHRRREGDGRPRMASIYGWSAEITQHLCNDCNNAISINEGNLLEALRHSFASVGAVNDRREPVEVLIEREGRDFVYADGNALLQVTGVRFDPGTKA